MFIDYGRQAYAKLKEFEQRLEKVEKQANQTLYKEINFNLKTETGKNYYRELRFKSFKRGEQNVSVELELGEGESATLEIKLNGIPLINAQVVSLFTFNNEITCCEGENLLEIKLYADTVVTINTLSISFKGNVEHVYEQTRITALDNYALVSCGSEASLFRYENGVLNKALTIPNCTSASIIGKVENELKILYHQNGNVKLFSRNLTNGEELTQHLPLTGATSVAGYQNGEELTILFIKLNCLYIATYTEGEPIMVKPTGISGSLIYADCGVNNAFVITGNRGAKAFFNENGTLNGIKIPDGNNYHIHAVNGVKYLTYNDGGVLKTITLIKGGTPKAVGYYEESVNVNGAIINRVKDNITITEKNNV